MASPFPRSRSRVGLFSATNVLVVVNILAYIWEVTTGGLTARYGLEDHGAIVGPLVKEGQWWRLVTGAFLHGGLLHITFNMIALFQVGTFLEMLIGSWRMLVVYFVSMLGSSLAVVFFNYDSTTVGASGAIFGIFGALVAIGLRLGPRGRGLVQQTLPIILINLVITFTVPNISAAAHVGGLVTGFLTGLALLAMHQAPERAAQVGTVPEEPEEVEQLLPENELPVAENDAEWQAANERLDEEQPAARREPKA